jgi:phospholipid/cholesterol/gamma-HCH transport system substrate-binding protein
VNTLTRHVKVQLLVFTVLTTIGLVTLGWYYLRLPSEVGIGQYTLHADLPGSGGLYTRANVTYRGTTIGTVTGVEPTERGARATMSINDRYKVPIDATANVHSVSAVGEQYLDLVSTGNPGTYFASGQTITNGTVPAELGPVLDAANHGLEVLPREKISSLLDETSQAVGGLGPSLQRLADSTQALAHDFKDNINTVNDIISHSGPILESQVGSGDPIQRWAANLHTIGAQTGAQDPALRDGLRQAPTANQLGAVFGDLRDSLPQLLANSAIVSDLMSRYRAGVEQMMVFLPQAAAQEQTGAIFPGFAMLDFQLGGFPPPCLTGFVPPSQWRSPADVSPPPVREGLYCKIPQDFQGNAVRGARNYPCVDVPGKRAATPAECRSNEPYQPLGTNPWYGEPNQIRNCPAPAARCDQPVDPGKVIPAPSVNNGMNPLPANLLPQPPPPTSDELSPPGQGTVQCSGQQPNPCIYTPASGPAAIYSPQSGEVIAPDGTKFTVTNSSNIGDDGWKDMLAMSGSP